MNIYRRPSTSSLNSDVASDIIASDNGSIDVPLPNDLFDQSNCSRVSFQSDFSSFSSRNHWSAIADLNISDVNTLQSQINLQNHMKSLSQQKNVKKVILDWKNDPTYTSGPVNSNGQPQIFDRYQIPSDIQLANASTTLLTDENGRSISFGDIVAGATTVVMFIRHSFCGFCQEFIKSISEIDPAPLNVRKIRLVAITLSDWRNIKNYRKMLNCSFPIYTNPERNLYELLGMSLCSLSFGTQGPAEDASIPRQLFHTGKGLWRGILNFKVGSGGDMSQLGGEFIFENRPAGEKLSCAWASRMATTRDHVHPKILCKRAIKFGPDPIKTDKQPELTPDDGQEDYSPVYKLDDEQLRTPMQSEAMTSYLSKKADTIMPNTISTSSSTSTLQKKDASDSQSS